MINDLLGYDLKIYQNEDYFKYSIDSVLLAEFVNINFSCNKILDLCTGNAPIPLILSERFNKSIVGVELQKDIFDLAIKSININNKNNITILNEDVNNLSNILIREYDIITCNPPYFKCSDRKIVNNNIVKAIARHELKVSLEQIICVSSKLIKDKGLFYIVYRCDRLLELIDVLHKYNFGVRKFQFVYNDILSSCCFVLVEAKYNSKDDLKIFCPKYIKE